MPPSAITSGWHVKAAETDALRGRRSHDAACSDFDGSTIRSYAPAAVFGPVGGEGTVLRHVVVEIVSQVTDEANRRKEIRFGEG